MRPKSHSIQISLTDKSQLHTHWDPFTKVRSFAAGKGTPAYRRAIRGDENDLPLRFKWAAVLQDKPSTPDLDYRITFTHEFTHDPDVRYWILLTQDTISYDEFYEKIKEYGPHTIFLNGLYEHGVVEDLIRINTII